MKVELIGRERVPKNKPVIIVMNHPTAFLEPMFLACWLKREIWFLIRGDLFKGGLGWLMDKVHGIPVWRRREGLDNLKKNEETFAKCVDIVLGHNLLMIFAEGSTEKVRRLRTLQKGTARIAFQAMDTNPDADVLVLPVGVVYSDPTNFRSNISMVVGDPIEAREYYKDGATGLRQLTLAAQAGLAACLPKITKEEEHPYEVALFKEAKFGQSFTDQWRNAVPNINPSDTDTDTKYLEEQTLRNQMHIGHYLLLGLGLIPSVIGYILHCIPLLISQYYTQKLIRKETFKLSVRLAFNMGLMFFYYIILSIVSYIIFGHIWFILAMAGLGIFTIYYFDYLNIFRRGRIV